MEGQSSIHLGFITQEEMEQDVLTEALELAKEADVAIVFVGNTTQWETEGQDLSSMTLPANGSQNKLIASVAAVNPNTIVVNTTGVPVELPWLDDVPAFVQAWYAGQETGNAILDILIGDVSPSGKLPVSWPKKYEHTGCYGNFGLDSFDSRKVEYVEGIFVGYRWFDRLWGADTEVRFPFGYGLSYTKFSVSDVRIIGTITNDPDKRVTVSATVTNLGAMMGSETVQVYLEPPVVQGLERPVKGLVGFIKVELEVNQKKVIEVAFARDAAAYWDEVLNEWRVSKGVHGVVVATSSAPIDAKARLNLLVEDGFGYPA
jgi:beta-glucosidase